MRDQDVYILIGEDDADDRFLLQTAFDEVRPNSQLAFVENGVELLDFLAGKTEQDQALPVFILLDLNMPKKDGREVLRELKAHATLQRIPVIMFSTTSNEHEIRRCYELGANSYITKPDSFGGLQDIVKALCGYWLSEAQPALSTK
jgi:two-component system response regulator